MRRFRKVEITEQQLEDMVRRYPDEIEKGLVFVDHQKPAGGGRLDVLLVDSGKSLVVAELKIVEDDQMLVQGLDYYNDVVAHVETYARLYKEHQIDPTQEVRLILIAPTFSQTIKNRCKWLKLPVALFTFTCGKFEEDNEITALFADVAISSPPEAIEVFRLEDQLDYITNAATRSSATSLLDDIKSWKPGNITLDAIKGAISLKVNNRVFVYLNPRREHFVIGTYSASDD